MDYSFKVLNVVRVVDGDTVDVLIDLGFSVSTNQRLRLIGIDAPETRTRDLEEKKKGFESKEWLILALDSATEIKVLTEKTGKYGRYLATIYADGVNLNRTMLELGLATVYGK